MLLDDFAIISRYFQAQNVDFKVNKADYMSVHT